MAYRDKVKIVVATLEDLSHREYGPSGFTGETPVGDQSSAIAERYSLVGCQARTTVGEIAQVLWEREIVTEERRVTAEAIATVVIAKFF